MDILGTLGLDQVSGNPDDVPVGNYDAEVFSSEYVLVPARDDKPAQIAHVLKFKVVSQDQWNGAKPSQWNTLGTNPVDAEGNFPAKVEDVAGYTPTMSDQQKNYYKQTWIDCGTPADQVGRVAPETLVGRPVVIRAYVGKNGYKNIAVNGSRTPDTTTGPTGQAGASSIVPF